VVCNREKAYISRVFSWGQLRGHCAGNPAEGVPRLTEHARTRYVTDDELAAFAAYCAEESSAAVYLIPIMELCYLLRARTAEALDIKTDQINSDGVLLKRRKGSKDSLVSWSPRLRAAVDAASAAKRERGILSAWLFVGSDRARLKEATVQTAFQRLMRAWSGMGHARWTIHDLKAKGITDTANHDKLAASGHRDPKMLAIYDRLPGKVTATR
jgi:integrase